MDEAEGSQPSESAPIFGVDSNILIDFFEEDENFWDFARSLIAAAELGVCRLTISQIVAFEVLIVPKREEKENLYSDYCKFFKEFPNLTVVPTDWEIITEAVALRVQFGFDVPDSLILASAICSDASIFVTRDSELLKKGSQVPNIETLHPSNVPLIAGD